MEKVDFSETIAACDLKLIYEMEIRELNLESII